MFSICYELSVELTFPVGEAASGGIINSVANLVAFIILLILTSVLSDPTKGDVLLSFIVFGAILIISLIFILVVKVKLRRTEFEN
jgi:hypothetical protein